MVRTQQIAVALAALILLAAPAQTALGQRSSGNWTQPVSLSEEISRGESAHQTAVVADSGGSLHIVWTVRSKEGLPGWGDAIYYTRWDGDTFTQPVNVLVSPGGDTADAPAVTIDQQNHLHVVWRGGDALYHSSVPAQAALSAGSWRTRLLVPDRQGIGYSDIACDPDGTLHVVYEQTRGLSGVHHTSSSDRGQSWSNSVPVVLYAPDSAAYAVRLALGSERRIHVTWTRNSAAEDWGPAGVYYSRSEDGGLSWSEPFQLAGTGYGWCGIEAVGDAELHAVWSGTIGYNGRYWRWSNDGGRTWNDTQRLPGIDSTFGHGWTAMAVDAAQAVHLATGVNQLHYSSWQGGDWASPEVVVPGTGGFQFISSAVLEGNTFAAVYGWGGDIWLTERQVPSAPHVAARPLPTLGPSPTETPAPTPGPSPSPTRAMSTALSEPAASPLSSPLSAVMLGVLPAAVLAGVVIAMRLSSGRR